VTVTPEETGKSSSVGLRRHQGKEKATSCPRKDDSLLIVRRRLKKNHLRKTSAKQGVHQEKAKEKLQGKQIKRKRGFFQPFIIRRFHKLQKAGLKLFRGERDLTVRDRSIRLV